MAVTIIDNRELYKSGTLNPAILRALERCGLAGENFAKVQITAVHAVDTGALRNSLTHRVDSQARKVMIGSALEYAPYVELGTGQYYPGGRTTPWCYQDAKGDWHWTRGNPARPYLVPAITNHREDYKNCLRKEGFKV